MSCNFFNTPQGCRRGRQCKFSHIRSLSPASSNTSTSRGRGGAGTRGGSPAARSSNAPKGVCNFYWRTGKCKLEFDCRFQHTNNEERVTLGTQCTQSKSSPAFLTDNGLQNASTTGNDVFFSPPAMHRSPTETHNGFKNFLRDDYRFAKAVNIHGFVILFNNVSASNAGWVSYIHLCLSQNLT